MNKKTVIIIHDIRSVENVGAMFRTADAAGVEKMYLTGYTPTPLDRFGRKRSDLAKSALGAEDFMEWEQKKSLPVLISMLKKQGYTVVGVEQDKSSIDYRKIKSLYTNTKLAFIMGNEVTGIPKNILTKCDAIAEIPMYGKKESLNVSVALGVVLFGVL
jgi:tRNA G18 (ribose-2'-O)-methylase SpoU